jgi:hypothetical protein
MRLITYIYLTLNVILLSLDMHTMTLNTVSIRVNKIALSIVIEV